MAPKEQKQEDPAGDLHSAGAWCASFPSVCWDISGCGLGDGCSELESRGLPRRGWCNCVLPSWQSLDSPETASAMALPLSDWLEAHL